MKQRPLRVAMLIQSYLPRLGGAERQLAALVPLLRAQNVTVEIFTRRYQGLPSQETIGGAPVFRSPLPHLPGSPGRAVASLAYTLYTLRHLRARRPDLVHAHELLSPATTAVLAHRLWRIPIVTKVLRGGELGDIYKLHNRPGGRARLAALRRHVATFIAISREIDDELAAEGIPPERRAFIPNGVDTGRFAPVPPASRQRLRRQLDLAAGPVAVYSGRLVPEKQVDLLVALWPRVRAAHPDASLLLLGDGPEAAHLRALAGPGVRLAGRVDDVAPVLQAADLFVLPSATEGLSNALLEAMACGLPAVATAVGGAPDLIEDGHNGLLVAPGDVNALAQAVLSLCASAERRAQLGQAARAHVKARYDLEDVARRLRALYDCVLSAGSEQTYG